MVWQPYAITNAVGYAKFYSRSHDAVIRVYDAGDNVIKAHERAGEFKEWQTCLPLPEPWHFAIGKTESGFQEERSY